MIGKSLTSLPDHDVTSDMPLVLPEADMMVAEALAAEDEEEYEEEAEDHAEEEAEEVRASLPEVEDEEDEASLMEMELPAERGCRTALDLPFLALLFELPPQFR